MPTLNWIGKEAVVRHHKEVPCRLLEPKAELSCEPADSGNLIVQGDNLHALKALLPRGADAKARYKNPDDDTRGPWASGDLQARNYYSEGTYSVTCPSGRVITGPGKGMYWRVSKQNFDRLNDEGRIWWGKSGNDMPRLKRYLLDVREKRATATGLMCLHKRITMSGSCSTPSKSSAFGITRYSYLRRQVAKLEDGDKGIG